MIICKTIAEVLFFKQSLTEKKRTIGFVPTMGALHKGHLSLIEASKKQCGTTVCSIFVNPTQFNDKNDLARYPRTPQADIKLLEEAACDMLFMPSIEEIYPQPDTRVFSFAPIDEVLDGLHRPGHFNGVAQVVSTLFDIVQPHQAFFGLKDFQQVLIIQALVKQLHLPVQIVPCPILREPDGLAMSSRNALLNTEERKAAALIPKLMQEAKELSKAMPLAEIEKKLIEKVKKEPLLNPEYLLFCDAQTLQPVNDIINKKVICLIAVYSGKIRLIDNIVLS
ncbi:MAG: pantoate--beta-alanine ligase [Bacteroidetes bacterium]|nr:pantoate--beta-alanine ligase [Bacteroidota bacterium]